MSSVLPFDISALIIDIIAENKDTDLLKELALVSHSFHQICSKHLFATVELHSALPGLNIASSKKGFVKLLNSRPDVVRYIRKLTYKLESHGDREVVCDDDDREEDCDEDESPPSFDNEDDLLSPMLPNFLRTISFLNCFIIDTSNGSHSSDWNRLNSSLTSAFLHLMHLPTIKHIDLSFISEFPLSSLTSSVNLRRLDISRVKHFSTYGKDEILQSLPKICEFHTSGSLYSTTITTLLHAKRPDGRPAFNFMDLRRVSMPLTESVHEKNIRYLLQNAKLLEKLNLSVRLDRLVGLHEILSPIAPSLKVLDLKVFLSYNYLPLLDPFAVLCEELEAMAGHNILEALSFFSNVCYREVSDSVAEGYIGYAIQKVEKVLVKSGWSALRQVFFIFSFECYGKEIMADIAKLQEALQFLGDKYLNISKLEFDTEIFPFYAVYNVKCELEF